MNNSESIQRKIEHDTKFIYEFEYDKLCTDNDRVFSWLLGVQWIFAIVLALVVTPRTWIGSTDHLHVHVIAAIVIGGLLSAFPIYLNLTKPGAVLNRYVNVVAQALYSALFIHLTGGRIETHFHVFGSLAFFSFYRDIRVLFVGSLVVVVDHILRSLFLPQSVFGLFTISNGRWMEHAGWVLFEDFFLAYACLRGVKEMRAMARQSAQIMAAGEIAEQKVRERTNELSTALRQLEENQAMITQTSKMSALGEMAGGIAHEINSPLAAILLLSENLALKARRNKIPEFEKHLEQIGMIVAKISRIITGLKNFSRDGSHDDAREILAAQVVADTLIFCQEKFKARGIVLQVNDQALETPFLGVPELVSQVLLNLFNNSLDAVSELPPESRWIRVQASRTEAYVEIAVADGGPGIPAEVQAKMMQPFYTTKDVGQGTGLGLSISKGIIEKLGGRLEYDASSSNTRFVIRLPRATRSVGHAA